jgi:hypothetical protein
VRLEAVVEERTEAASQILSTQLTRDKIDSDILRTARPIGMRSVDPHWSIKHSYFLYRIGNRS